MVFSLASCFDQGNQNQGDQNQGGNTDNVTPPADDVTSVMTYEEYIAAEMDAEVVIEAYVQATQSWWADKITVYLADQDGAYFVYEMACSEQDAAKLVPGAKIRVTGYKGAWAGEIEIMDATFEFVDGAAYVAPAVDVTEFLGTDALIDYQNFFVSFKGLTVKEISYKNGAPGDDIYVTFTYNDASYSFCVERYLTGPETEVYKAVQSLQVGDVVDVKGFLYWYEGANTHITSVKLSGVMSYDEYVAAELNSDVVIESYVQATQSWWADKITVYLADEDGAYFAYEMACSEQDAAKLLPGTKIRVSGYKGQWAGEIEIMDGSFVFVEADPYIATAKDVTEYLGTDSLIDFQNQFVSFKGLTVVEVSYKNGEPGDDIYVTFSYEGNNYSFCVERYLTPPHTEVYQTVGTLKAGDVVDVEGFLYWYEGANTHMTSVTVK